MKKMCGDKEKLVQFARKVIKIACWDGVQIDGFDVQDLAEKYGLVEPHIATAEDIDEDSEFEVGDTIYKYSDILKGRKEGK